MTSHFDDTTDERVIVLQNGMEIRSGWLDNDDPDALPSGDYLSVFDKAGQQQFYAESSELLDDPIEGRRLLNQLFQICCGDNCGAEESETRTGPPT